jgi:hypothetical protein
MVDCLGIQELAGIRKEKNREECDILLQYFPGEKPRETLVRAYDLRAEI